MKLKEMKSGVTDSELAVLQDRLSDLILFVKNFNVDETSQVELLSELYNDLRAVCNVCLLQIDTITGDYQEKALNDVKQILQGT